MSTIIDIIIALKPYDDDEEMRKHQFQYLYMYCTIRIQKYNYFKCNNDLYILLQLYMSTYNGSQVCKHSVIVVASTKYPAQRLHVTC